MMVIRSEDGQFSIAQMLSETHTTRNLVTFFMNWLDSCQHLPREIVCDESRALLNASVKTFCNCNNIEKYADQFAENIHNIPLRVRIDSAHFLNKYRKLLKVLPRTRKVFWLGAIGRLILAESVEDAREVVKCIYIVACSEFNHPACEYAFQKLKERITGR